MRTRRDYPTDFLEKFAGVPTTGRCALSADGDGSRHIGRVAAGEVCLRPGRSDSQLNRVTVDVVGRSVIEATVGDRGQTGDLRALPAYKAHRVSCIGAGVAE
jgi:hypothetical protein